MSSLLNSTCPTRPRARSIAAERTERALAVERICTELRTRTRQMEAEMSSREKTTFDITAEMSRQFKSMQDGLNGKVVALEAEIKRLREDVGACAHACCANWAARLPRRFFT